mmetsp:Transcript_45647/g.143537  ORF Transcript_45647/g.143537 Transcript_45647/m.143537 type:complete len:211 (-) Transcript_45647:158-790(-)
MCAAETVSANTRGLLRHVTSVKRTGWPPSALSTRSSLTLTLMVDFGSSFLRMSSSLSTSISWNAPPPNLLFSPKKKALSSAGIQIVGSPAPRVRSGGPVRSLPMIQGFLETISATRLRTVALAAAAASSSSASKIEKIDGVAVLSICFSFSISVTKIPPCCGCCFDVAAPSAASSSAALRPAVRRFSAARAESATTKMPTPAAVYCGLAS